MTWESFGIRINTHLTTKHWRHEPVAFQDFLILATHPTVNNQKTPFPSNKDGTGS